MVKFELVGPDGWDARLAGFADAHIRQTAGWARYKTGSWKPVYSGLFNGPTPVTLGLCLVRGGVVWLNGGPAYKQKRPAEMDRAFLGRYLDGLKAAFPRSVIRLNCAEPMDVETQLVLRQRGFRRPLSPIDAGLTYVVDLTKPLPELEAAMDRRWRGQLRRAQGARPRVEFGSGPELRRRYAVLHEALRRRKKVAVIDADAMAEALGERMEFALLSVEGQDGCGGAVWTLGSRAWFALSAANEKGLELDLPNAFYWAFIERLQARGLRSFDLTGIDPGRNWGVFNFKRGVGASPVEQLGEWEWSASDWKRRAFNLALWARGGI